MNIGWWLEATEIKGKSYCVRMGQVECVHRYMRKVLLLQPSENFAWWSKFAAVTRMECVDHTIRLGCFGGSLWATCAIVRKKVAASDTVIYLNS